MSYKNILIYLGIGPKRHLDDVGLTTLVDRPGVGSNLQDHIMILMDGLTNSNEWLGFDPLWNIDPMKYLTWLLKNPYNGPLGDSGIGTGAFIHTPFENKDPFNRPQIQLFTIPLYLSVCHVNARIILGISDKSLELQREHKGKDGVSILPALLRPKSTGTIRLASTNHHDHPLIDPQYLKHPDDVKTLVEALKIVKNIYDSKHFKYDFLYINYQMTQFYMISLSVLRNAKVEPLISPLCKSHKPWSEEYFRCVVQNNVMTVYHPVGTCKMGSVNDTMAVVNASLKVLGTQKLRVIDASVMPKIIGGNTNAATVMIGEKGADMIIKQYQGCVEEKEYSKVEL